MQAKNFKTKTEYIPRNNGMINGIWEIGLDIGYSAVKLFSPNIVASFPSYARRIDENFAYISNPPEESIIYKDNTTGEMWLVGEVAQDTMSAGDTSDSLASLYGRDRYFNPLFHVISSVGLGVGMMENEFGAPIDDKVVVQTGLPERYMSDADDLIDSLAGDYDFSLKVGAKDWYSLKFSLTKDRIFVMSQPRGTLFSISINKNGSFVPDAMKYLDSNVLIFDPGFGTLDIFSIEKRTVGRGETFSDLGMKRVLQETCKSIKDEYGVSIEVPEMQKYLETGSIKKVDRKALKSNEYHFSKLLFAASEKVCDEAISRMMTSFNLAEYSYLVVTGGTGAAWLDQIKNKLKNIGVEIIYGNQNDTLSFIYSNVRGYYVYRYNKLFSGK